MDCAMSLVENMRYGTVEDTVNILERLTAIEFEHLNYSLAQM